MANAPLWKVFHADAPRFYSEFQAFLASRREETSDGVAEAVRGIMRDVRARGDAALVELTAKYDHITLTPETLRVSDAEIDAAFSTCPAEVVEALRFAATRIEAYHQRQVPESWSYEDGIGNTLGMKWNAVDAAGVYVPGGKAFYPSSVLMNAIPVRVAGVQRIAMVVPTPHGVLNPALLVAAKLAGVSEVYRIGGAQAVAALAYGTATIPAVNVIVGPGNAYVAEAKRQVFGTVGIDMIAGPSEIAVIADGSVPAAWVAADLLSQAEHDTLAQSILITTDEVYAEAVHAAMLSHLATLPRRDIAAESLQRFGVAVLVHSLEKACEVANLVAAEHLEIAVADAALAERLAANIRHAGAIFMGAYTPEAIGDYVAGPSHVLPTLQSAAFASGLSVHHFLKKTSLITCNKAGFNALAPATATLADCEGLQAHALSVRIRTEK
jgi:histidinol dehydrogenase